MRRVGDSKALAQQVLEIGSIGGDFSELLRAMRAQLPVHRASWSGASGTATRPSSTHVSSDCRPTKARRALADASGMADRVLAASVKQGEPEPGPDVLPALEKLVAARRDALRPASRRACDTDRAARGVERRRARSSQSDHQLRALLNSRLLWLPSSAPVGLGLARSGPRELRLDRRRRRLEANRQCARRSRRGQAIADGLVLLVLGAVTLFTRRLHARLAAISEAVGRYSTDNYWRTPEALLISALLALKTPLAVRLCRMAADGAAAGVGFCRRCRRRPSRIRASLLTFLRFVQFVCIENGLFSVHFGWPERARAVLWQNINWLKYALTPATFILAMIDVSSAQNLRDGLGRFAFLAGGIVAAVFLGRVADPRRGILAERLAPGHPLWVTRVALAYAAHARAARDRGARAVGLLRRRRADPERPHSLGRDHLRRVPGLQRRYARGPGRAPAPRDPARLRAPREGARAARGAGGERSRAVEAQPAQLEEPEVDIASISEQTRKLVRLVARSCCSRLASTSSGARRCRRSRSSTCRSGSRR